MGWQSDGSSKLPLIPSGGRQATKAAESTRAPYTADLAAGIIRVAESVRVMGKPCQVLTVTAQVCEQRDARGYSSFRGRARLGTFEPTRVARPSRSPAKTCSDMSNRPLVEPPTTPYPSR